DGVATDIAELREHGMPVWARGLSAVTTKRLFSNGEFCTTISCGGVPVNPGDCILADENGVLVLPPDPAAILAAADRAIGMQKDEKANMPKITAGEKISDLNGTTRRIDEMLAAQKSAKS
ncbi:MAG: RraA family protein, partial [Acetobacteraceae bacterium]|nr:RraA family protein [Acetobacteraceae bacterium]